MVVALVCSLPSLPLPLSTVHPMEVAVWGDCRGPGGRGSLCGHCCQELTAPLHTWTLTCAPQLPPGSLSTALPGRATSSGLGEQGLRVTHPNKQEGLWP